jgi:protein-S-isoprenylcysteine O-methyltransferase Ste14
MGRLLFALVVPAVELAVGPWALTGFHAGDDLPSVLVVPGAVLLAAALLVLVDAYTRLAPSPVRPSRRLVRSGVYRFARHPMYIATTVALVAEAFVLRRAVLLAAAGAYALALGALARWWEVPQLRRRFPEY